MIEGGYYLKARCIQNAEISCAPPHIREIWDWLIKEACHSDKTVMGTQLCRGQLFTSYQEIRDGLAWKVGYRTERYSKNDCETAMNYLKKHTMINTTKTTRGMIVTICKYDYYQSVSNYETYTKGDTNHTRNIQPPDTINKNEKKERKKDISPSDFLEKLKTNPAYSHINIDMELSKMDAWLSVPKNKGRQKTPRFILNWLNKIEGPLQIVRNPNIAEEV